MTKQQLYCLVEKIRNDYGINYAPPYDAKSLCTSVFGLHLSVLKLKTPKLRGMSHIPSKSVLIDAKRSDEEQNFYCMHEIIHQTAHSDRPTKSYSCYDETQADQDPFIEWQANEGAAQFLVPYQDFIPHFMDLLDKNAVDIQNILARRYHVTSQVISFRMDSLAYEIDQYREGKQLDRLELLSRKQRRQRGITTTSYSAICDFALAWDSVIA